MIPEALISLKVAGDLRSNGTHDVRVALYVKRHPCRHALNAGTTRAADEFIGRQHDVVEG